MESEIFQNMVLSPGQSLEDYFSQLSEKAQILRKHDHELVAKFISGLPEKMSFFVRAGQPVDAHHALTSAKMAEACGYRQHGDSINALKHENKHAPRQLPGKSNIIDSNQSEVIRDLQNQVAILTDLVQGKHKEHVQSEPSHSDVHDIRDQIGQLSGLITSMAVREVPHKEPKRPENTSTNYANTSRFDSAECRRCKGLGHFQRVCNWNGYGQFQPSNQCQLCNQNGHIAQSCTKLEFYAQGNRTNPGVGHNRPG
ncbi:unnamed protein product [Mytilus edulis]|uniref:CCHC-type domain-containing protein n=1 Tax=Mytilus edulis TaxID=6550 RepID=A0A8S3R2L8_MYTED|nr:unnamed protein product [Mytilus edulis]